MAIQLGWQGEVIAAEQAYRRAIEAERDRYKAALEHIASIPGASRVGEVCAAFAREALKDPSA